jgi:PAS domain S-box-containing protein
VNPFLIDLIGFSKDELLQKKLWDIGFFKDDERSRDLFSKLQNKEYVRYEDLPLETKDGRSIDVEFISNVYPVDGKNVIQCNIRDITARHLAEESLRVARELVKNTEDLAGETLRLSEDKFRYVFDYSPVGKSIALPKGEIDVNKAFCDMLGYSRQELQSRGWQNISHPDDIEATQRELDTILSGQKETVRSTKRYFHKDGSVVWADVSTYLRRDNQGKVLYFMTAAIDITGRKLAEERVVKRTAQLEAANYELDAFAYSVSHDLRAPLRAVNGFARILMEECQSQLSADAQHYLNLVRTNSIQMGQLIDDLLTFSRTSRQAMAKRSVNPGEIVRQVLKELESELVDRKVEVIIGDLPECIADPAMLERVIFNLISNAIKFTRNKELAHLEIGSINDNGIITYFVRDNGIGFDMHYSSKLFEVFQRLHSVSDFEGTGVGLAVVKRIIQKHGGRVWAEAEVDKGATFYFTLGEAIPDG